MPKEVCSNQSVTQQWAGTVPHRTRMAAMSRTVAQVGGAERPAGRDARPAQHQQPDEQQPCAGRTPASAGRGSAARSRAARCRPPAGRPSSHEALQLNIARRIASEASDQENENRRILVRAVASAVRKCSSATAGTSGALSSSRTRTSRPKRQGCRLQRLIGLGIDADVEAQPGQEREDEGDPGEDQAPAGRRDGARGPG